MRKKNKWLKHGILLIVVLIGSGMILLSSYVLQDDKQLMAYQNSLTQLPEVSEVLEISEYYGKRKTPKIEI